MITQKYLRIYQVDHRHLNEGTLVVADSVQEAIRKFNEYWISDYDISSEDITGVKQVYEFEVLDDYESSVSK